MRCLCTLFKAGYDFNFKKELVSFVAPMLNSKYAEVRTQVAEAVQHVVRSDEMGQTALEVVRIANKIAKKNDGRVRPELVNCFLDLQLSKEILDAQVDGTKKVRFSRGESRTLLPSLFRLNVRRAIRVEPKPPFSPTHF